MNSPKLIIEAGKTEGQYWRDLVRYRELFYFLAWRDILVRYKQTVVGFGWSVVRPLLTMLIFTIVFGKVSKLPDNGVPYPLLVFCALLPWQFFANALSETSSSVVNNANMISKVYFPRLVIPVSAVIVSFVDFLISFGLLCVLLLWYGISPGLNILFLPLLVIVAFFLALGVGLWMASLTVKYRDFRFIVTFMVQFGLYVSPVGFSSQVIPKKWMFLYSLNPMVGVIDGFRWSILGVTTIYVPGFIVSILLVALLLASGIWYFRRTERRFADII